MYLHDGGSLFSVVVLTEWHIEYQTESLSNNDKEKAWL